MESHREGNYLVICFKAQMDSARSADLAKPIETAIVTAKQETGTNLKVQFDVTQVPYAASSFLRICLTAAKSVGAASFSIVGANETLRKVFAIAGFDKILSVL